MIDRDKLRAKFKTRVIEQPNRPKCQHHWQLKGDEGVPLRGKQSIKHPDCIGRKSTCKLCGVSKILPERVF